MTVRAASRGFSGPLAKAVLVAIAYFVTARFGISLFNLCCQFDLLLRRQKGKARDLSQVCVNSGIALIHIRTLIADANLPLLRRRGILQCRS